MADEYPVLFKKAVAQHLDDLELGLYKPSGNYTPAEATLARPAIVTGGPDLPVTFDNCIVLTLLQPLNEGRADRIERIQFYTRLKTTVSEVQNFGYRLERAFDLKENVPPGMNVSWSTVFSSLYLTADTLGRRAVTHTVYFRGRRPQ